MRISTWMISGIGIMLLASCTPVIDADPGISRREADTLKTSFYWTRGEGPFRDEGGSLERLMDDTPRRVAQGGEKSELQMSSLVLALASIGDRGFSQTLATRAPAIQQSVLQEVLTLWDHYQMQYPLTQTMAERRGISERPVQE